MTREEEIEKAANKYAPPALDGKGRAVIGGERMDCRFHGFIAGARWADEHPKKSPWISIKDRLPEHGQVVLVKRQNDIAMAIYFKGNMADDVEYWMPIPPIPKKGE